MRTHIRLIDQVLKILDVNKVFPAAFALTEINFAAIAVPADGFVISIVHST